MIQLRQCDIWPRPALDKPKARGDFDIYINVERKVLLIPAILFNLIVLECNAQNAQTAMEYLHDHQVVVARVLKWTEKEVHDAFQKLVAHINGRLNMPQPKTQGKKR